MALIVSRKSNLLGRHFVLSPERYDPRRSLSAHVESILLGELVNNMRKVVHPSKGHGPCLVLDTSDVREGIVTCRKHHSEGAGSTKKSLQPRDVIISRLRPYLRQVAYVDDDLPNIEGANLLCSTEFFVLRGRDSESIAFLVPFLLSSQVQEALAASQEGGHHPRFDDSTLLALPVPMTLINSRKGASAAVEKAITLYRQSEKIISNLIDVADQALFIKQ